MLNANQAKQMLGCDDATLNNYINNGTIRAQRVDGQVMLNEDDVVNLANAGASDSDDGTIILSGDSEELSIDLGEVVDDSAATMIQPLESGDTESITFGDDLEVVSFDDGNTEELTFDDTGATADLSFTEEQTVVMTDVDETAMQTATATSDFQTVDYDDDEEDDRDPYAAAATSRRSVRSQRVRTAAPKTHWIWPTFLILTLVVAVFMIVPFYPLAMMPREEVDHEGFTVRGIDDNGWTNLASSVAGFSIEPDRETFQALHRDQEFIPMHQKDPNQPKDFRAQQYLSPYADADERRTSLHITHVEGREEPNAEDDGTRWVPTRAVVRDGGTTVTSYNINQVTTEFTADDGSTQTVTDYRVELDYGKNQ